MQPGRLCSYPSSHFRILSRYCRPVSIRIPPRNTCSYTPPIIVCAAVIRPEFTITERCTPVPFALMMNDELGCRFGSNRYGTMFYGEFDSTSRKLYYVNAGGPPPLLLSPAGEVTVLRDGGLLVGIFADAVYQNLGVKLTD
jgi:hypothetical protein